MCFRSACGWGGWWRSSSSRAPFFRRGCSTCPAGSTTRCWPLSTAPSTESRGALEPVGSSSPFPPAMEVRHVFFRNRSEIGAAARKSGRLSTFRKAETQRQQNEPVSLLPIIFQSEFIDQAKYWVPLFCAASDCVNQKSGAKASRIFCRNQVKEFSILCRKRVNNFYNSSCFMYPPNKFIIKLEET